MPTLRQAASWAVAINNHGQVIGNFQRTDLGGYGAFLWDAQTGMRELPSLNGSTPTVYDINDLGQVVGGVNKHAFLWSEATGMLDLGVINDPDWDPTGEYVASRANAINNRGVVVGTNVFDPQHYHFRILWDAQGGLRKIEMEGELPQAHDINDAGKVVGTGGYDEYFAFAWTADTGLQYLELPSDAPYSGAHAINDRGQIAGFIVKTLSETDSVVHACVWLLRPERRHARPAQ